MKKKLMMLPLAALALVPLAACQEYQSDLYGTDSTTGDPAQATQPAVGRGEGELESMPAGNVAPAANTGSAVGAPMEGAAGPSTSTSGGVNQPTSGPGEDQATDGSGGTSEPSGGGSR